MKDKDKQAFIDDLTKQAHESLKERVKEMEAQYTRPTFDALSGTGLYTQTFRTGTSGISGNISSMEVPPHVDQVLNNEEDHFGDDDDSAEDGPQELEENSNEDLRRDIIKNGKRYHYMGMNTNGNIIHTDSDNLIYVYCPNSYTTVVRDEAGHYFGTLRRCISNYIPDEYSRLRDGVTRFHVIQNGGRNIPTPSWSELSLDTLTPMSFENNVFSREPRAETKYKMTYPGDIPSSRSHGEKATDLESVVKKAQKSRRGSMSKTYLVSEEPLPLNEEEELIININELADHYATIEFKEKYNKEPDEEDSSEEYKSLVEKHTHTILSFKRNKDA